jgi:hypothetical protein
MSCDFTYDELHDKYHQLLHDKGMSHFHFKYGEGKILDDVNDYIQGTYGAHYTNENNDVQTLDVFESRGTLSSTSIDNAIKYLMRYGKKSGKNKMDLIKAMHYLVLATAFDERRGEFDSDTIYEK